MDGEVIDWYYWAKRMHQVGSWEKFCKNLRQRFSHSDQNVVKNLGTTVVSNVNNLEAHTASSFMTMSKCNWNFAARNAIAAAKFVGRRPKGAFLSCIQAQISNSKNPSVDVSSTSDFGNNSLEIKEWEFGRMQDEITANQGIKIRGRPTPGPPKHYVGHFEFRLQNEGNIPRNILEEIVWYKDVEVSQLKERCSLLTLKKAMEKAHPVRDFVEALRVSHSRIGMPTLITEVKKASPSRGVLRDDFDPVEIAKVYERGEVQTSVPSSVLRPPPKPPPKLTTDDTLPSGSSRAPSRLLCVAATLLQMSTKKHKGEEISYSNQDNNFIFLNLEDQVGFQRAGNDRMVGQLG